MPEASRANKIQQWEMLKLNKNIETEAKPSTAVRVYNPAIRCSLLLKVDEPFWSRLTPIE
jgi:hypothetical protein